MSRHELTKLAASIVAFTPDIRRDSSLCPRGCLLIFEFHTNDYYAIE